MAQRSFLVALAMPFLGACSGGLVEESSPTTEISSNEPSVEAAPAGESTDAPRALANGFGTPSGLAVVGDRVFFTTRRTVLNEEAVDTGALFVVGPVGEPLMLSLNRRGSPYEALAIRGDFAFVASADGRIVEIPLLGGSESVVAEVGEKPAAIAARDGYVYIATVGGAVLRVPAGGGELENLGFLDGTPRSIVVRDGLVYFATAAREGSTTEGTGGLVRFDLQTHTSTTVSARDICALVDDGTRLFWTTTDEAGRGALMRLSLGSAPEVVASGEFSACALAADATNLFFATMTRASEGEATFRSADGRFGGLGLMRTPIAGGDVVPVVDPNRSRARPLVQPGAVAVDARHVYWLTETAVMRATK